MPAALSRQECETLVAAADAALTSSVPAPCRRVQLAHLESERCREIFARLLNEITFGFLEREVPDVAQACFGQESGLADMRCTFNTVEPAINVYTAGGDFKTHQDGQHLTLLVHLSAEGAFTGGGTAFWRQARASEFLARGLEGVPPDVVIKPRQGDAMFWNGDLVHAGCAVDDGKRHILVGSFSLSSWAPPAAVKRGPRIRVRGKDFI